MKHLFIGWVVTALLCLLPSPGVALTFPDKPTDEHFWVDNAGIITPEAGAAIDKMAFALWQEQQLPVYVVTIRSLADYEASGYSIEGYAADLFDQWGIGSNERNYGMLLLVSVGDRKARIEFGAGFGREHDRQAEDVMQSLIIPKFKGGDYATGIVEGVRGMDAIARGLALPQPKAPWWFWPAVIVGAIFLGLLIYNLFKAGKGGWAFALLAALAVALFFILRNAG
ncbi:MAG: TPM domain-containing protein, partial [Nitrospinae bacterium]|nr:TPM domain-containing protein [Nitrospinota bacterium]